MAVETDDKLPTHQVAVVVFTKVEAVDFVDASYVAQIAVRRAIRQAAPWLDARTIVARGNSRHQDVPVDVVAVDELSVAVADGRIQLTVKPLREDSEE